MVSQESTNPSSQQASSQSCCLGSVLPIVTMVDGYWPALIIVSGLKLNQALRPGRLAFRQHVIQIGSISERPARQGAKLAVKPKNFKDYRPTFQTGTLRKSSQYQPSHVFYAGCRIAFRCRARVFAPLFWVRQNTNRGCVGSKATRGTTRDIRLALSTG